MSDNYSSTYSDYEPEITTDAFAGDPILAQYQTAEKQNYWTQELESSRQEHKNFINDGNKCVERYASRATSSAGPDTSAGRGSQSDYNLFFANTDIKLSALYARTPQPDIKRRFDDQDDEVSRVAGLLLERNICFELDTTGFDQSFKQTLFDWKVPGVGIMWARFEQIEKQPDIDPMSGMPIPGSEIADQMACLDYVNWSDFLWAPCQVWQQCRWVARRIPMDKDAVKKRFGQTAPAEVIDSLTFAKESLASKDGISKNKLDPRYSTEKTVDVYEIWDKQSELIYWVAEGADMPLDVQEDTNNFDQFFPTPMPPLGRVTTSNTTPISDFALVANLYNELDNINKRISNLARALQLKWVYDASFTELKDLYTTSSELEGLPVTNWAALQSEKGGLAKSIEFTPLEEVASAYAQLLQAREQVKQQIYEVEGIADIMRGAIAQGESTVATQSKVAFGTSRLSQMQMEVAQYVEALLRLKAHLICKFYKPQTILNRVGTLPQADQPFAMQAIQLLKNQLMRNFRLTVSVDSIQLPNWNTEKAMRNEAVQVATGMLAQLIPAAQQFPAIAPLGLALLRFNLAGYKGSAEIEGIVDQGLQQIEQAAMAKQSQPQQPNPAQIKAQQAAQTNQTNLQIAEMQEQTKRQQAVLDAQSEAGDQRLRAQELDIRRQKNAIDAADVVATQHADALDSAHQQALDLTWGR